MVLNKQTTLPMGRIEKALREKLLFFIVTALYVLGQLASGIFQDL